MHRRTLLLSVPAFGLAACGGGNDAAPVTVQFSADRPLYRIGEQAQLTVRFTSGTARIEPEIGAVADGAVVTTPPLDRRRSYRLVVELPGQPAVTRELTLDVRFRDQWVAAGSLVVSQHAAVSAADGSVIVIGGDRGLNVLSESVDRFDPASRRLARIASLSTGRASHSATRLADGRILVAGGLTSLEVGLLTELIDPVAGTVTGAGRLTQSRHGHAATLLADGRVLVSGGTGRSGAEVWEPSTGRWRLLAARMQHDRAGHSATLLADGRVLIGGGSTVGGPFAGYVFAEIFDPGSETFTPLASATSEQRSAHVAWRAADGRVMLLGGEVFDGTNIVPLASTLRVDVALAGIAAMRPLAAARSLVPALVLPDDRALLIGGQTATELASASATSWHAEGGESPVAAMPAPRVWHTANRLPDGRVLVLGGEDGHGAFVPDILVYE